MFLERGVAQKALMYYERFMLHNNFLLKWSLSRGRRNYTIVFKTHALWHIADQAKFMNPRFLWCYEFETFMGMLVKAAKACVAGTPMLLVGNKVLENWLLVAQLRLRAACQHASL